MHMYIHISSHIDINTNTYIHVRTHAHTYTRTHSHTRTHIHIHTHTRTHRVGASSNGDKKTRGNGMELIKRLEKELGSHKGAFVPLLQVGVCLCACV